MALLRRFLNFIYTASGVAASLCLIAILALIVIQMLARWTGEVFPGAPDYAGYAMASASFLAFANALNKGSHIRVSLLLNALQPKIRRVMEIWCFSIGTLISWYFVFYCQNLCSGLGNLWTLVRDRQDALMDPSIDYAGWCHCLSNCAY